MTYFNVPRVVASAANKTQSNSHLPRSLMKPHSHPTTFRQDPTWVVAVMGLAGRGPNMDLAGRGPTKMAMIMTSKLSQNSAKLSQDLKTRVQLQSTNAKLDLYLVQLKSFNLFQSISQNLNCTI